MTIVSLSNARKADGRVEWYELSSKPDVEEKDDNRELIAVFTAAKRIEGCSEKTLKYYQSTLDAAGGALGKNVRRALTEDLKKYLTEYQERKQTSRVTINNIHRILSSFFFWLEEEDYIIKSPARRIYRVKTVSCLKETYADEELERMRDDSPALFVSLRAHCRHIQIGGIERMLRQLGRKLGINKSHPRKFRRTLATMAIDKGMPIEQLQRLLGRQRIDATLQYAMVKTS